MKKYIFVGLGNPGEEYLNTRHNVGRIILESFKKKKDFSDWKFDKKINALVSEGKIKKTAITLVMPETFMNKSGDALKKIVKVKVSKGQKSAEDLVVIHDDLDIPLGKVKMSFNKSSGGHRGVESIIKVLKTEAFIRVRVGVVKALASGALKKPVGDKAVGDFILGKFSPAENDILKKISKHIEESLEVLAVDGREIATGVCNTIK
ncbi:MAG: aminoacyl-tRNA hydrolase [bacterium]|nr:aminoacyl-tRNA hydrolase [bacterium]